MRQALGWVLAGMVAPFLMGWADAPSDSDWQLETKARAALNGDATLGPLNLGVRVERGRATVWGPVTTPELGPGSLASGSVATMLTVGRDGPVEYLKSTGT